MLEVGLCDELITESLAAQLTDEAQMTDVDNADAPHRLAEHIARILHREFPGLEAGDASPPAAAGTGPAGDRARYAAVLSRR